MNYKEYLLSEFEPMNKKSFLNKLIFENYLDINELNTLCSALSELSIQEIDIEFKEILETKIPFIFQYLRNLGQFLFSVILKNEQLNINLSDIEIKKMYDELASDINWFIFKYFEIESD